MGCCVVEMHQIRHATIGMSYVERLYRIDAIYIQPFWDTNLTANIILYINKPRQFSEQQKSQFLIAWFALFSFIPSKFVRPLGSFPPSSLVRIDFKISSDKVSIRFLGFGVTMIPFIFALLCSLIIWGMQNNVHSVQFIGRVPTESILKSKIII